MGEAFTTKQIEALLAALPDAALAVDVSGIVVAENAGAVSLFGVKAVGEPTSHVLRSPAIQQAIETVRNLGQADEVSHVLRGKVPRSLTIRVARLGETTLGRPLVLLTIRDLTREQQIEKMRADFVANASHELRTPLASLSGFIDTLQGAAKSDPPAQARFLDLMKTQAQRMASLIDDLLSLSRIEINEHVVPTGQVDLVSLLRQSIELLQGMALKSQCTIRLVAPKSFAIAGDANELAQVFGNLLENAIKYGGTGKPIEVTLNEADGVAIVAIKDHGPGIASEHVPRLTERFYRVNVQDSRARGGTGLGLAITKHIVNRHRGRLQIESEVGHGSTFSVHLPIDKNN